MSPKPVFRRMTPLEVRAATVLGACSFFPGTSAKSIARGLAAQAAEPKPRVTDKQAACLWRLVWNYRRQVRDLELVDVARAKVAVERSRR